jgi:hypothetical protein
VAATAPAPLLLTLLPQHYPFWSQGLKTSVKQVEVLASYPAAPANPPVKIFAKHDASGTPDTLATDPTYGPMLDCVLANAIAPTQPLTGSWNLYFSDKSMTDLWLAITWTGK